MFDGFIYRLLDTIVLTCENIREWMINRSLPKGGRSPKDWAKDYKNWKKTRINKNDTE